LRGKLLKKEKKQLSDLSSGIDGKRAKKHRKKPKTD
jgi:hypothetical protein